MDCKGLHMRTLPFNSLQTLVGHVDYEDPHFHTVLVSLGQLAKLQPAVFSPYHKTIVRDNLVKNLFVVDRASHCVIVLSIMSAMTLYNNVHVYV